jgi:hypothetical protein
MFVATQRATCRPAIVVVYVAEYTPVDAVETDGLVDVPSGRVTVRVDGARGESPRRVRDQDPEVREWIADVDHSASRVLVLFADVSGVQFV